MLGVAFQLGVGEAAAGQSQEKAVNEAEVIADVRLARARRQQGLHVVDLAAHLVPDLRQPSRGVLRLYVDLDNRQARARDRVELGELRQLLDRPLETVGDLELDLLGAGARIGGDDGGGLDRELGVLEPSQGEEAADPPHEEKENGEIGDGPLFDGESGKVHVAYPVISSGQLMGRTSWPSRRYSTPAVTMSSPGVTPSTFVPPVVTSKVVTGRFDTVEVAGSITQTNWLSSWSL